MLLMSLFSGEAIAFKAGAAKVEITPPAEFQPMFLAGFLDFLRVSTGVHDPLWARVVVVEDDGGEFIAIMGLDLTGYMLDNIRKIKRIIRKRGYDDLDLNRLLICSSHTHGAPDTVGLWGATPVSSGVVPEYIEWLNQRCADAFIAAWESRTDARIRFATASTPPEIHRDDRLPININNHLPVMQICDLDGNILATLESFCAHPTITGSDNTKITADYCHYLYQRLEELCGGIAVHISSDIGAQYTAEGIESFRGAEYIGTLVADTAYQAIKDQPWSESITLDFRKTTADCLLTCPIFFLAFELGLVERQLYDGKVRFELHYARINDAEFITFPGEAFPEVGYKVKQMLSGSHQFILGLCNDELGYIVPWETFNHNEYHEELSIGPKMEPVILEAYAQLLGLSPHSKDGALLGLDECFIATAAFGNKTHPAVRVLRQFRDKYLLTNPLGRSLVKAYYQLSPRLAKMIAPSPIARFATRLLLYPLAALCFLINISPLFLAVPSAIIISALIKRKRG